jgi:hypothetical protein
MALLQLHHNQSRSVAQEKRSPLMRRLKRIGARISWLHRAIMSAKLRSLNRELMFRHDCEELLFPEHDIKKIPQRPLIVGDKWDF